MIDLDSLTDKQLKVVNAYSFAATGWFSAVSDLIVLGLKREDAEDIINKTGIMGLMI